MEDLAGLIGLATGGTILIIAIATCGSILFTIALIFIIRRVVGNMVGPNKKILQSGVAGEATIVQIQQTGVMVNYQPQALLTVQVQVPGWEPYQAQTRMVIPQVNIPSFQPGAKFPCKVDPDNRATVVLDVYGTA